MKKMTDEKISSVFNYLKENLEGVVLKSINDIYDTIYFKNGESFKIYEMDGVFIEYLSDLRRLEKWIEYCELDDINDYDYIITHDPFDKMKENGFIESNQAVMIPFKEYALKVVNKRYL